jgi:hypothetical protein
MEFRRLTHNSASQLWIVDDHLDLRMPMENLDPVANRVEEVQIDRVPWIVHPELNLNEM